METTEQHFHPWQLVISAIIALIAAAIAGGPGWYDVFTEEGADPSLVEATVIWTRKVEAVSLFQGTGVPSAVQEFNIIENEATFHATVTNDGGKSTTIRRVFLLGDLAHSIELDVTLTVLAHDKGEIMADIRPNEFSRAATEKMNCAVEDGKCVNDARLPFYRLHIEFDPGGFHSLDVDAEYSYEVTATCSTEEVEPPPVAACLADAR